MEILAAYHRPDVGLALWQRESCAPFSYSDGAAIEARLLQVVTACSDRRLFSAELARQCIDWPSRYHLSPVRTNLMRPFTACLRNARVLELGAGCGGITRFLGELGAEVIAVEGSPKRARINAERCRDLTNVHVVVDRLQDFTSTARFDVVTLIGVLEYAPVYIETADPVGTLLQIARHYLQPNGLLLLAIENQLGLKYFCGAPEDHVNQPMFGLNDSYGPGTVVTFGRQELVKRLHHAGFTSTAVYAPFPDYKFPISIIYPDGLTSQHPDWNLATLLSNSVLYEAQPLKNPLFSLEQAWQVIARNGLVGDLANSLLIAASPRADTLASNPGILAAHYGAPRLLSTMREQQFVIDAQHILVRSRPYAEPRDIADDAWKITPYQPGVKWFDELVRCVNRPHWRVQDLVNWLAPWHNALRAVAENHLPGNYFDAIPTNLLCAPDGTFHFIDLEWQYPTTIPITFVLHRGLFLCLQRLTSCAAPASDVPTKLSELTRHVLAQSNQGLIDKDFGEFWKFFKNFQNRIAGYPEDYDNPLVVAWHTAQLPIRRLHASSETTRAPIPAPPIAAPIALQRRHDLAVVLHLYHTDLWEEFRTALLGIGHPFDLFVTVPQSELASWQGIIRTTFPDATVLAFPNRGRDVLPFLRIFAALRPLGYTLICKLHTKKSEHLPGNKGQIWRTRSLLSLVSWRQRVANLLALFAANLKLGLFVPFDCLYEMHRYDRNWPMTRIWGGRLLKGAALDDRLVFEYPAGSMFWCRPEALDPLLQMDLCEEDFEEESGQLDGTLAHIVERLFGLSALAAGYELRDRLPGTIDDVEYQDWLARHRPDPAAFAASLARIEHATTRPCFHCFVVLDQQNQLAALADTIDSLAAQHYPDWRLTVISPLECPDPLFETMPALAWQTVAHGDSAIMAAFAQKLPGHETNWVSWLYPGDQLEAHAFLACADWLLRHPACQLFYSDEDRLSPEGVCYQPQFKPDCNPDGLRALNYLGGFWAVRGDVAQTAPAHDVPPTLWQYALALQLLEQLSETAFGHITQILLHRPDCYAKCVNDPETIKALLHEHATRQNWPVKVSEGYIPGTYRYEYLWPSQPWVSIIIPTRDRVDLLQPCVESLFEKTAYPHFDVVIVDNDSVQTETHAYFDDLRARYGERVAIIPYPHSYNYAAINNLAARQARGDYLVLLNNDTVIIQAQWLERLLDYGQRPDVGVVGARLVYADQRLQHAGVILGMGAFGVAEHPHIGLPLDAPGYMQRAQIVQNFSAVTAACMLVRKSVYEHVQGLDEQNFQVLFNDVDFCLKVREAGWHIVWTPFATLIHHGSRSITAQQDAKKATRARQEADRMLEKWLPQLARDPAYHRHLSLKHRHFQVETKTEITWELGPRDRLRVWAFPANDSGIGQYRVRAPLTALVEHGLLHASLLPNHDESVIPDIVEIERAQPDVILLQNGLADYLLHAWEQYRRFNKNVFRIYAQDDLIYQLPAKHPLRASAPEAVKQSKKWLKKILAISDRLIVATEPLREAFGAMIADVRIVPNYLERTRWTNLPVTPVPRRGKPRVGWAGGSQHQGDLEFIAPIVAATHEEIDWVFLGMCPESILPYLKEKHSGVPFDFYPAKLASLDLDLAIAPLEYNAFNEAKTNLRLLEYGILGWPVLCSDIFPYRVGDPPVWRVANQPAAWIKTLREAIHEPDALRTAGLRLQQWVLQHYMLEDHLDQWLAALTP